MVETLKAWFRNLNRFYLKWWHSTIILQNITNRTPLVMLITSTQQTCDHLMSFWTYSESLKLAQFFWISVDHLLYFWKQGIIITSHDNFVWIAGCEYWILSTICAEHLYITGCTIILGPHVICHFLGFWSTYRGTFHSHRIAHEILIPKLTLLSILREILTKLQHKT